MCAFEIGVRGHTKSVKMAQFERPYATSYQSAIVNIALSCTIFLLFDVVTFKGHSRSLEMAELISGSRRSSTSDISEMVQDGNIVIMQY